MIALVIAALFTGAPSPTALRTTGLSGLAITGPESLVLQGKNAHEITIAEVLNLGDYKPVLMVTLPPSGPERAVFIETPDSRHYTLVTRVAKESLGANFGDKPPVYPSGGFDSSWYVGNARAASPRDCRDRRRRMASRKFGRQPPPGQSEGPRRN